MDRQRRRRIKQLFQEALRQEPTERLRFLAAAGRKDSNTLSEVEELLAAHQVDDNFLERPTIPDPLRGHPPAPEEIMQGRRIGNYRLQEQLGHGGMGAVFLASREDDEFEQRVAIKLIPPELLSSAALERFHYERQILADLEHPNIARLLDGGTSPEGLPYIVMEYVDGLSLDRYCDKQDLSTTARLTLFQLICSAVQYAHRHLIVHRDLKPGNILVTAEGTPKLLDFGIAKLLASESAPPPPKLTHAHHRPMTPEYASPEQAAGRPVNTASDVYSLGVVLFRLLTGKLPYHFATRHPDEVARVICDSQPLRPSAAVSAAWSSSTQTGSSPLAGHSSEVVAEEDEEDDLQLRRELTGDLDNIVLMALHKEPERRYGSVEQFSEDIRRHLEGLPVIARPSTWRYRAEKFVGRHRFGVAAALLIALTLIGGIAATVYQARIARQERAIAERRFADVRRLANVFLFDFHDAIADLPGATPARELVVTTALDYLDRLSKEAGGEAVLLQEVASAYDRVGDVQGNLLESHLGDKPAALASYRKALSVRQDLVATDPTNAKYSRDVSVSNTKLGNTHLKAGDAAAALEQFQLSMDLMEISAAENPASVQAQRDLVDIYEYRGRAHEVMAKDDARSRRSRMRSWREARSWFERSLAILTALGERQLSVASDAERRVGLVDEIAISKAAIAALGN